MKQEKGFVSVTIHTFPEILLFISYQFFFSKETKLTLKRFHPENLDFDTIVGYFRVYFMRLISISIPNDVWSAIISAASRVLWILFCYF